LNVDFELSDNDTSATTGVRRAGVEQLLELAESGAIRTVLVWHPDRLYRKLADLVRITSAAERHKLIIVSVEAADMDLTNPFGRMSAAILGAVASHEGEHRTMRQKLAYRQAA